MIAIVAEKKAVSNTIYLFLDWIAVMGFGYLFWVVLAKLQTPEIVGRVSSVISLGLLLSFVAVLGFNTAITKLFPEYLVKKTEDKVKYAIGWTLKITLLAGIAFLLATSVAGILMPSLVSLEYGVGLGFVVLTFALYTMTISYLMGLQKMRKIATTDFVYGIVKISLAVLLASYGFVGATLAFIAATVLVSLWRIAQLPKAFDKFDRKEVTNYSIPAFFVGIGLMVFNQINIVAVNALSGAAETGIFAIAFMFSLPIKTIPNVVSNAISPLIAQHGAENKPKTVERLIRLGTRYSLLIIAPLVIVYVIFTKNIILLFSTSQYLSGELAMRLLSISYPLAGLGVLLGNALYSSGQVKNSRNVFLTTGIVDVLLCLLLIPMLGSVGSSVAYLIASVVLFFGSAFFLRKTVRFSLELGSIFKYLVSIGSCVGVSAMIYRSIPGVAGLVAGTVAAYASYFTILLLTNFFTEDDVKILREVQNKVPYAKPILEPMAAFMDR